jgi:hypothetical protein
MAKNGQKSIKMTKNDPKMVKKGSKMVKNGQKWPKMAKKGVFFGVFFTPFIGAPVFVQVLLKKMIKKGQKRVKNGQKWPKKGGFWGYFLIKVHWIRPPSIGSNQKRVKKGVFLGGGGG